ncbi:MAG: Gfo/Idh/MocA family protein [Terrimicrobiaceae bacterium]
MKTIAFIDHDIDNWHAKTFARLIAESNSGFRLGGICATRKENAREWALRNDVPCVDSIPELEGLADYIMVLAPSNPETHMDLCRAAFQLGKPTYVDKTFAPDEATALSIFEMADAAGVPVQTSSVLRYTKVQDFCHSSPENKPDFVDTWGGGSNFQEYIIHQVEMVVSLLGPDFEGLRIEELAHLTQIDLAFGGHRAASIHMTAPSEIPFLAVTSNPLMTRSFVVDEGRLFVSGLNAILDFFSKGHAVIDRKETLTVMRILDELKKIRNR